MHERIHFYLISHEELVFRNDYVVNYVYLLLKHDMYDRLETVLLKEIWFLYANIKESKSRKNDIMNWKVALGIVYMIMKSSKWASLLVNENKVRKVDSGTGEEGRSVPVA